jgi:hypothetical protein
MTTVGIGEGPDLFRCVNQRIVDLAMPFGIVDGLIWLICECPNDGCTQPMRMTRSEYDNMCAEPGLFALVPGHERNDLDEIVASHDRYLLFRPARAAASLTPRR